MPRISERIEADVENSLIDQKNAIISQINSAQDGDELKRVDDLLDFVSDMWNAVGYGYKVDEVQARIQARAKELYSAEMNYIALLRKNDRTMGSSRRNAEILKELAGL